MTNIDHNAIIANMDQFPRELVVQAIKESLQTPSLLTPENRQNLKVFIQNLRIANTHALIDDLRNLISEN